MPRGQPSIRNGSHGTGVRRAGEGDLSRYREKRDFSKTPEPGGELAAAASQGLRFVIQKHAARRLHYDFRLELGGVLKSWAVAKGPSLDPAEKRLAIHVEDHPIDYGDFEGIIPKGEYGGGTVMIWDRGFWRPEGDPAKGYAKGHLAFELDGEKLHGRWHLIRTKGRPGDKKEQWLLFKSDDEYAEPAARGNVLEEAPDSVASRRSMEEIAGEKDAVWSSRGGLIQGELSRGEGPLHSVSLRQGREDARTTLDGNSGGPSPHPHSLAGAVAKDTSTPRRACGERDSVRGDFPAIAPSRLDGAKKASLPKFAEPCLALLAERPPEGDNWLHEIKFDGYRLMAVIEDGRVRLLTRRGLDWTDRFPGIADALSQLPLSSAILDGEAVVEDENGVSSFSALQDALSEGKQATAAVLFAFDLIYLDGYSLRDVTLEDRKDALEGLLRASRHPALRYSEHVIGYGRAMIENACRLGLEGIVSKRRNAPYRSGRHGEWLKAKCTNREEFVVGGYAPSTAARNAIGSLALGYYNGGKLVYVGRTGTGFTQKSAQSLYKALQELRADKSPFASVLTSEEQRGLVFVRPQLVAEVEFRGWTADRHIRQSAFKGLREDKPAEEVQLEMPRQTTDGTSGKPGKTLAANREPGVRTGAEAGSVKTGPVAKGGTMEFAGVKLTHPERILWEGQGLTKLGLAEYYAEIAGLILPHIVSRPLALVRCPNGAAGECFFQKRSFAGLTDAVEIARLPEEGGDAEVIVIHDLAGLINLVQASVLEIHPWGARIEDVDHPDTMIFDLDPGEDTAWSEVIGAAHEVRQRLRDLGIESYVKTSGGKGLHVVSPIKPEAGWGELKSFTHGIAAAMEADSPSKYTATMAKKARGGKIFIDYLRNGRGATAVAPYSTRARPGAPISTPVRWEELGPELTASRFNVANIGRRLAALKSDPWEGFFASPQPIAAAIRAVQWSRKGRPGKGA
jgi:bifunctional non-homologous end joining protein LigD